MDLISPDIRSRQRTYQGKPYSQPQPLVSLATPSLEGDLMRFYFLIFVYSFSSNLFSLFRKIIIRRLPRLQQQQMAVDEPPNLQHGAAGPPGQQSPIIATSPPPPDARISPRSRRGAVGALLLPSGRRRWGRCFLSTRGPSEADGRHKSPVLRRAARI